MNCSAVNTHLEGALSEWQNWPINQSKLQTAERPRVIKALSGGKTNQSWLITLKEQDLVLRLEAKNAVLLGIDRRKEAGILQALEPLQLSPRLLYQNPTQGYSLFPYYPGRQWSLEDFAQPEQMAKLYSALESIQALPLKQRLQAEASPSCSASLTSDYLSQLRNYQQKLNQLNAPEYQRDRTAFEAFYKKLTKHMQSAPLELCHHDLCPENIIENEQSLVILDWEYAGLGLAGFDKAYIGSLIKHQTRPQNNAPLTEQLIYWLCHFWNLIQTNR